MVNRVFCTTVGVSTVPSARSRAGPAETGRSYGHSPRRSQGGGGKYSEFGTLSRPVEGGAERLGAAAGRGPVGALDDVDDVAGVLGGDRGGHALADPVDQLHDVLEDV